MDYSILLAIEKIKKEALYDKYFTNNIDSEFQRIGKITNSEVITDPFTFESSP